MPTIEEKMLMIKDGVIVDPFQVELHLTNVCTHECKWCIYRNINSGNYTSISYEKAINIIEGLKKVRCESVLFSGGGEPLAHKNAEEIIWYAHSLDMNISLITNGGLLGNCDLVKLAKAVSVLRISVDSYSEVSYKAIHRPKSAADTFSSLLDSISEFMKVKDDKKQVILSYILDEESIIGVVEFAQKAVELGVDGIDIKTDHNLSYMKRRDLIKRAYMILNDMYTGGMNIVYDPVKRRINFVKNLWVRLCYQCIIEADGSIYPCCHTIDNTYLIGNVNDEDFEKIWYGKSHIEMIKHYYEKKECCPACSDSSDSKMICRIINKME